MPLAAGTRLGPYEIIEPLGSGGMGEVCRARDTRLDRVVAIKVLHAHLADHPDRRARFEREARLIAQLNHPHICALYDVGRDGATDYLVVEYLDGQTLAERLQKGPLPIDQALRTAIEIADALDVAHKRGIVHRDLKPANVMLTKSGAKLLDFGIAKAVSSDSVATLSSTLTMDGALIGTPQFMAPEQLEGRDADPRSDLFAFGAVLYEMLTGTRAFEGETVSKAIAAVLGSTPPSIAANAPLVPPVLDHLVRTCLEKNADDRWQTASDVRRQLEWIASTIKSPAESRREGGTSFTKIATIGFSLVIVAVGVMSWALWKRLQAAPEGRQLRLEISTPSTATSRTASLAISPDGLTVAFVADSERGSVLWLRPLDGAARPLEGTVGAQLPFWSPDSQAVGFFADGKLKRTDVKGGAPQILADALDPQGGTWGKDGTIIFTPHQLSPLVRIAAAGGKPTAITQLSSGQTGHVYPRFLHDGLHVVYFATGSQDVQGIYVCGLDGTSSKEILAGGSPAIPASAGYLMFVREGVLLAQALDLTRLTLTGDAVSIADRVALGTFNDPAASASNNGDIVYRGVPTGRAFQLSWFNRSGRVVRQLGNPDSAAVGGAVSLSPDRVAFARRLGDATDVWLLDADLGGAMSRLTVGGRESSPVWSRDGKHVVYTSGRNGGLGLYLRSVDGDHDEPMLVRPEQKNVPTEWSPDGHTLLFINADEHTHLDILALPVDSTRTPFPVIKSEFEDINPQFGPDGTWIVYQSNISNRYELYVRRFLGGGASVPITVDGATQPRLRRDGKEVFYLGLDHWLMALPIQVSANARSVKAGVPVRLFRTEIGGPESGYAQRQYAVTADGQQFLFDVPVEQPSTPIVLIQNWRP
jgi:eukaryotic-like serine/threonine-protein kinase